MVSKTFCILPWIHFYANADGTVLPCCIGNHRTPLGNLRNNTVTEIWNTQNFKQIRLNMLKGKRCNECSACYEVEDKGLTSFRQSQNQKFSNHLSLVDNTKIDGSLDEVSLRYFDIRWSNICNMKCRSCSSTYSSNWATEDNTHLENKKKIFIFAGGNANDNLYNQLEPHFKDIETFYFAGGEPLLTDKHYDILEYLIANGKTDVELSYNTNMSVLHYKNKSVIDLWKHFSNVTVRASLDSWGARAEYIREGTDWKTIEQNLKRVKLETSHVNLQSSTVVSVFNILTLVDFIEYLINENLFDIDKFDPSFYNLINPSFYSVKILPSELKMQAIEKLKSSKILKSKFLEIVPYLDLSNSDLLSQQQFAEHTRYYDNIRNRNFIQTFPELQNLNKF
jgi:radical SAM protein with 4Fe4S-binding SPASM domain